MVVLAVLVVEQAVPAKSTKTTKITKTIRADDALSDPKARNSRKVC